MDNPLVAQNPAHATINQVILPIHPGAEFIMLDIIVGTGMVVGVKQCTSDDMKKTMASIAAALGLNLQGQASGSDVPGSMVQ